MNFKVATCSGELSFYLSVACVYYASHNGARGNTILSAILDLRHGRGIVRKALVRGQSGAVGGEVEATWVKVIQLGPFSSISSGPIWSGPSHS